MTPAELRQYLRAMAREFGPIEAALVWAELITRDFVLPIVGPHCAIALPMRTYGEVDRMLDGNG